MVNPLQHYIDMLKTHFSVLKICFSYALHKHFSLLIFAISTWPFSKPFPGSSVSTHSTASTQPPPSPNSLIIHLISSTYIWDTSTCKLHRYLKCNRFNTDLITFSFLRHWQGLTPPVYPITSTLESPSLSLPPHPLHPTGYKVELRHKIRSSQLIPRRKRSDYQVSSIN